MRRRAPGLAMLLMLAVAALSAWYFVLRTPPVPLTAGAWLPVVTTIAGRGTAGFLDGSASAGAFEDPFAVAVAPDGAVYVADAGDNNRIRRVTPAGMFTVAGGAGEGLADGIGTAAAFHTPSGLTIGADGTVYVTDTGNHAIRRITPDGRVVTVAGSGRPGYRDGHSTEAAFNGPIGIALARDDMLYIADTYNDRIRRIDARGMVSTVAGSGTPGLVDGAASSARFDTPTGIAMESDTSLLVADTGNHVLRRVDLAAGVVTTLVPVATNGHDVSFFGPIGVAASKRSAFVTDRRGRILQLFPDATARILAGWESGFADGLGSAARFFNPTGIAVDREGALIVADAGNYVVRRIAPPGLYAPDAPRSPLAPAPGFSRGDLGHAPLFWPVDPQFEPHEVAGTMGEPRGTTGGDRRDRFHAGIDIRADHGSIVRAVRRGKVDRPVGAQGYGSLNESLSVGPLTYVHLKVGRDRGNVSLDPELFLPVVDEAGQVTRVRVRRGTRVDLGDTLGTVNGFNHVHLNAGPAGRELNPLVLGLPGFRDTIPPSIAPRGIQLSDETGRRFEVRSRGRLVVTGRVRIVVDAWDRADGNKPARRLGLYRLGYQVLGANGLPAPGFEEPRITMVFDRLPSDPDGPRLVYAEGSGITAYGNRRTRYLYTVTNRIQDGVVIEDFWDTRVLPPGDYTLRVLIGDSAGNQAITGRDLRLTIAGDAELSPAALRP